MLADLELMRIHIRALFTHNAESRLLFVNEPSGATFPAPRLFLGRTRGGNVWRFRADVPENIAAELDALCADEPAVRAEFSEPPRHVEAFVRLLEQHAPVRKMSRGLAYQFTEYATSSNDLLPVTENNAEVLQGKFEELIPDVSLEQPFVARIEGNRAVSVCRSVRITLEAHEAGLETLSEFRGKGYAQEVTAEWALRVRAIGAVPLYSTSWENTVSQSVARKLNLECYGVDFQII
ncbi:MAG: GNAT family N-acetyltransferase [Acidobacteriota bacterium]|nr:GNAT family N-acetyltransferase [Acidobacteriota bacterium]